MKTNSMFLQGSDIITMTLSYTEINCYNNISTDHFVFLYIPSFNLGIFMIKAFLFQEKDTFLSRAYYQFLMPISSLDNNFEEIECIKAPSIPHCTLFGDSIHIYTIEHDDPLLSRLYEYLYHDQEESLQEKIKSIRFRNILLGI